MQGVVRQGSVCTGAPRVPGSAPPAAAPHRALLRLPLAARVPGARLDRDVLRPLLLAHIRQGQPQEQAHEQDQPQVQAQERAQEQAQK